MGSSVKLVKPSDGDSKKCLPVRKTAAGPSVIFANGCGEDHKSIAAVCEICGRVHSGEKKTLRFLQRCMVIPCCGRLLDDVYKENGQLFCIAHLKEFSEDPSNPKFAELRKALTLVFANSMEKLGTLLKLEGPGDTDFTVQEEA